MKIKFFVFLCLLLIPALVFAQTTTPTTNPCSNGTGGDLGRCVGQIYIWSLAAAALLALLMIIFGGYLVMTAAGNAEQSSRGKSFINSSLVGLVLLLGAYLILSTINPDLTNFNIRGFNDTTNQTNP